MEGIVNHARKVNPYMDIVLMYFIDPDKTGDYKQGKIPYEIASHDKVAQHYNLPSIDLSKEIYDRINNNEFTWKYDFVQLHPSPFGCELYFQAIRSLLEECWGNISATAERKPYPSPEILDKFSYIKGSYVDVHKAVPGSGWKIIENWNPVDKLETREGYVNVPVLESVQPGAACSFEFRGTAVGICVASGPDAGKIEYSLDGKPFQKIDLFTRWSRMLHLPWYVMLNDELSNSKHTVRIRISEEKNEKSSGNACRIIHFLVNNPGKK
jgi:sialidase-1